MKCITPNTTIIDIKLSQDSYRLSSTKELLSDVQIIVESGHAVKSVRGELIQH